MATAAAMPRATRIQGSQRRVRALTLLPSYSPCHLEHPVGEITEMGGLGLARRPAAVPGALEELGSARELGGGGRESVAQLGAVLAGGPPGDLLHEAATGEVGDQGAVATPHGLAPLPRPLVGLGLGPPVSRGPETAGRDHDA